MIAFFYCVAITAAAAAAITEYCTIYPIIYLFFTETNIISFAKVTCDRF